MSDSVKLWKTRAIIQMIVIFINLAIISGGMAFLLQFSPITDFLVVFIFISFLLFLNFIPATYNNFIQAGTYISKKKRKKMIENTMSKETIDDITDSTLADSVSLRKLYANVNLTFGFLIFALLVFFSLLAIFSKYDPFIVSMFFCIVPPFSCVFLALIFNGCKYLMEVGMYLKELEDRNLE